MSENDLLTLARAFNDSITSAFGQIITVTFAMVVAIFYFLNQAKTGLKIFAYVIYSIGMFLYFGLMLASSNVMFGIHEALKALPADHVSRPTAYLLAVNASWIGLVEGWLITGGFWILWLGVAWLLFVWRKADHIPPDAR
ncbi:MAG TPA: hypothetical protein VGF97_12395 [Rhizomicrobium sp.]